VQYKLICVENAIRLVTNNNFRTHIFNHTVPCYYLMNLVIAFAAVWLHFRNRRYCIFKYRCFYFCVQSAFRVSTSTKLDDRIFAMEQCKILPVLYLIQSIYPDLYPVHALNDKVGKIARLTVYLKLERFINCCLLGNFCLLFMHWYVTLLVSVI